jgi:flagellar assembly protein FliH
MAIPKEFQSAYQRWEMTSFGDERPSTLAQRAAEAEKVAAAGAAAC